MSDDHKIKSINSLSDSQFEALFEISQSLLNADYQDTLIEDSLDIVISFVDAERGLFVKYSKGTNDFEIIAARSQKKENIKDITEFSSGVLKRVIDKKIPILYHDVQSDPQISQFQSVQLKQIKSIIGVPILRHGTVWGVILADSQLNRKEFSEENLLFLKFFSNLISLSLDRIENFEKLRNENLLLKNQLGSKEEIPDMIGTSKVMRELAKTIHRVANTNATVLILGESGTGKDLAAKAIHNLSLRKEKPYLAQFCGSIPDNLLESELFGYKKGAFTGADSDKKGLLEVADKGTFFLDEIADVSKALQAKLLRVLENQEIMRLGDTQIRKVDVRIIAATNKDLKELVKKGEFRKDLFYRLNVFPIRIPPLRERKSDIPLLAKHFLRGSEKRNIGFDPKAMTKLENYSWPGNIRQLINVLKRALILSDSKTIKVEHIIMEEDEELDSFGGTLKDFELRLLKKRLELLDGNRTRAAESLGVSVRWVQMKLKEIGSDN
jgi:Nif-specific regulatory protein